MEVGDDGESDSGGEGEGGAGEGGEGDGGNGAAMRRAVPGMAVPTVSTSSPSTCDACAGFARRRCETSDRSVSTVAASETPILVSMPTEPQRMRRKI